MVFTIWTQESVTVSLISLALTVTSPNVIWIVDNMDFVKAVVVIVIMVGTALDVINKLVILDV
jgi:hypothetical protein